MVGIGLQVPREGLGRGTRAGSLWFLSLSLSFLSFMSRPKVLWIGVPDPRPGEEEDFGFIGAKW